MTKKIKVLIADDDQDIVDMLQYILEKEGYEVCTANNGKLAVEMAIEHKPKLVLIDIMMPIIDGIEACRRIREEEDLKDIFIVF